MDPKLDVNHPSELPAPEEKLLRQPTFMEKMGWTRIIFILILLIAAAGFFLYAIGTKKPVQNPTPTGMTQNAGWLTYTDRIGRFTIQYPKSYTITKSNLTTLQIVSPTIQGINTNFHLAIQYKNITPNQTMDELITKNKPCPTISAQNGTPSIINGKRKAQVYLDTPCGALTSTVIYTMNNDMLYIMSVDSQAKFTDIKQYVDPILATLQFTQN